MQLNKYNLSFIGLILFHLVVLLYLIDNFSISYSEALIYYQEDFSFLSLIIKKSVYIFGQNDFALRFPFILFYIGSSVLMYILTDDYFKSQRDRIISLAIFMILPGVNSAALLVNESIIIIFFTLLYLYLFQRIGKIHYLLLIFFLFLDNSFAILFLALFFYGIKKKDNLLLVVALLLFGISMSMYGFDMGGKPKGYLLDTFGIYATIFSPVLFLYFFYAIYRIGIKYEKDLFWYISSTALGLSLIFSLRQRIEIEDFAPFVVISIPIMVKLFIHSLRIRLKEFRKIHYLLLKIALGILLLNFIIFVFNKYLYVVINKPKNHFAYNYHVVKNLAQELKNREINNIYTNSSSLALRLKFYNINYGKEHYISTINTKHSDETIDIMYHNNLIKRFYINNFTK